MNLSSWEKWLHFFLSTMVETSTVLKVSVKLFISESGTLMLFSLLSLLDTTHVSPLLPSYIWSSWNICFSRKSKVLSAYPSIVPFAWKIFLPILYHLPTFYLHFCSQFRCHHFLQASPKYPPRTKHLFLCSIFTIPHKLILLTFFQVCHILFLCLYPSLDFKILQGRNYSYIKILL